MLSGMPFENVAAQDLKPGKTIKVQLNQLRGAPVLHVEHAGESNPGYWNETIAAAQGAIEIGDGEMDTIREAELLRRLKARFARHVVRDIERVVHDDGTPATKDDIPAYLDAMPRHAFLELVKFCRNPRHWLETGTMPAAPPQAVAAKSSPA